MDLFAYDADGNCMQLYVSAKPCPYQSIPTKVTYASFGLYVIAKPFPYQSIPTKQAYP